MMTERRLTLSYSYQAQLFYRVHSITGCSDTSTDPFQIPIKLQLQHHENQKNST